MPLTFNIFRIVADLSHAASKCILIWAIHWNRSAEGVSLLTQLLYVFVFVTRYLDLFSSSIDEWHKMYNFVLKIFYILSSLYIVFLMMRVYARTREREKAWKLGGYSFVGSALTAPLVYLAFKKSSKLYNFVMVLWTFSIELESFCILPQLLLLRQTTVPTVIDSYYLVTLGSYRAFYILNWIVRLAVEGDKQPVAWIFGLIQTAFYVDFAWVYFTRQRVKLRAGGIVDSDDLSRGWLVNKLVGRGRQSEDDDEDEDLEPDSEAQNGRRGAGRWGVRGISISADEGVHDVNRTDMAGESQPLADPDAFEDDESDTDAERSKRPQPPPKYQEVANGSEWSDRK